MNDQVTPNRRDFLRGSAAMAATFLVPSWVWSTGCGGGPEKNATWEARATELEGKGTVLTQANPGKWAGKEALHIPTAAFNKGDSSVTITTTHPMTEAHWISDTYIKNQDGIVIGYASWAAKNYEGDEGKKAEIKFTLPAGTTKITAYSYCNLHDHWVADSATVS